jgi:predicted acyl esterase
VGGERADTYLYDPLRPVPSLGGRIMAPSTANAAGPVDQRRVEAREDVLCYSTPVLDDPVEVTGHVSLTLFVSSSAPDTDFTGKLVDVFPDGRAIFLTDGILRARYRNSLAEPEPLTPGQVYEVTLDLSVTSNVFLPGHRIRLEVSSSNFPRFDRNTSTGDCCWGSVMMTRIIGPSARPPPASCPTPSQSPSQDWDTYRPSGEPTCPSRPSSSSSPRSAPPPRPSSESGSPPMAGRAQKNVRTTSTIR